MSVLVLPAPVPARLRLVCLPYAGGGSVLFSDWSARLPADVQVCAARLPGREARWREAPLLSIEGMAAQVADALEPGLDVPIAVYGHSMGGLIAFELAREMRRRGWPVPRHLFIAACRPAHARQVDHALSALPDAALVEAIERYYGALDPELHEFPELLRLLLPVLRADLAAVERYRFADAAPLDCDVTLFAATADQSVSAEGMADWGRHVTGRVSRRTVAGGHRFVAEEGDEPVRTLAGLLSSDAWTAQRDEVARLA